MDLYMVFVFCNCTDSQKITALSEGKLQFPHVFGVVMTMRKDATIFDIILQHRVDIPSGTLTVCYGIDGTFMDDLSSGNVT